MVDFFSINKTKFAVVKCFHQILCYEENFSVFAYYSRYCFSPIPQLLLFTSHKFRSSSQSSSIRSYSHNCFFGCATHKAKHQKKECMVRLDILRWISGSFITFIIGYIHGRLATTISEIQRLIYSFITSLRALFPF